MTTSTPKISVRFARKHRLCHVDWLDRDSGLTNKIVEPPAGDRVAPAIDNDGRLNEIDRRYSPVFSCLDGLGTSLRLRLSKQNRNESRAIDYQWAFLFRRKAARRD